MTGFTKPNREFVGKRIRKVKGELGLSLTELGDKLDLKKTTINAYIRGANLAPVEVIEKLALLSGKPLGWFYFGELEDYIKDYLTLRGYELVLTDYPDIPLKIKNEFLMLDPTLAMDKCIYPTGATTEFGYPSEDFILLKFEPFRQSTLQDYILAKTTDYIASEAIENKESAVALVASKVSDFVLKSNRDVFSETIAYGDEVMIPMLIADAYDDVKESVVAFDDSYLVGKLINVLNDDNETADLIRTLSAHFTDMDFQFTEDSKQLVEIIQSLRLMLIGLYAQKNQEDFHHWFKVSKGTTGNHNKK